MYRKADPDKWSLPYTTDPEKAMHFDNLEDLNKELKPNERSKLIYVNGEKMSGSIKKRSSANVVAQYGWTLAENGEDVVYRGIKIGDMDFNIGTLKANRKTVDEFLDTPSPKPNRSIDFDRGGHGVLVFSYSSTSTGY